MTTESASGIELEEIIVTAQKREESAQKTAVSIATVQRSELERKGITNLDTALKDVASVKITSSPQGEGGGIFIRGVGNNFLDPVYSAQPAVAINVDGIINTAPRDVLTSLFDVERVEVLRGPQGTLYGSSAEAGVVNVVMAQPSHELEARGRIQVGNYNSHVLEGVINLPLGDKLALRLTASDSKRDGYIRGQGTWISPVSCAVSKNSTNQFAYDPLACTGTLADALANSPASTKIPYPADSYGATGTTTYRGKVKYDPTDWLSLTGSYERSQSKGTGTQFVSYSDFLAGRTLYANSFLTTVAQHRAVPTGSTSNTFNLNAAITLGNFAQLTFLPARKKTQPVAYPGAPSVGNTTQDTYELRLNSLASSPFTWTLGAYKSKEAVAITVVGDVTASPAGGSDGIIGVGHPFDTKNVFGQVTYPVTQSLRLTGGARYTRTTSTYIGQLYRTDPGGAVDTNGNLVVTYRSPLFQRSTEQSNTSYKGGIEFDIAQSSMLYAQVSTGFKAGGLGLPPAASVTSPIISVDDVVVAAYKAETSTTFEVGSKNRFLDDRLQVNADVYYNQWKNMQLGSFACRQGATCASTGFDPNLVSVIYNADTATQYGLEVDVNWVATPSDRVDLSVSAMHGTYGNLIENAFGTLYPLTGHKMSNNPSLSGSVGYSHVFNLHEGLTLTPRIDEQFSTSYFNTQEYWISGSETPGYGKTDVTLTLAGKKWSVNAYGRNLFNRIQAQFAHPLGIVPSDPRVFGVGVVGAF